MPHIEIDTLTPIAAKYMDGKSLTPAERSEVLRIAQGFACKDSAAAANVSPETIRARRKRIYRKVHVAGAAEIISGLLSISLQMLASGEKVEMKPVAPTAQPETTAAAPFVAAM